MTWSYSGDPNSSDVDAVRFMVGDTIEADQQLQNEEIGWLLVDEGADVRRAAARGADTLWARYARQVDRRVGDMQLLASTKASHYKELSLRLWAIAMARTSGPWAGGISEMDKDTNIADTDRVPAFFARDMMEYPDTGLFEVPGEKVN